MVVSRSSRRNRTFSPNSLGILQVSFQAIFDGELPTFAPSRASRALASWGSQVVERHFGTQPEELGWEAFDRVLAAARAELREPSGRERVVALLQELGIPLGGLRLADLDLWVNSPGMESLPEVASSFFAHRLTWQALSEAVIQGWLPLVDVDKDNGFRIYPDSFHQRVENDSEDFLLEAPPPPEGLFLRQPAVRPKAAWFSASRSWEVSLQAGQFLLFSAGHLRQTTPNIKTSPSFALDFRFFRQEDLEHGRGAPLLDNASRGSGIRFFHPCDET